MPALQINETGGHFQFRGVAEAGNQHRLAALSGLANGERKYRSAFPVHVSDRFIEQQNGRVVKQGARKTHPCGFAGVQRVHQLSE